MWAGGTSAQNLAAGLQGWAIWAVEAIFPLLFHKPEAGMNFMVNSREKNPATIHSEQIN